MMQAKGDGRQGVGRGRPAVRHTPQAIAITPANSGKSVLNPRKRRSRISKRQRGGVR